VHNSEGDEAGPMSVLDATANSVNTAYTEMARQLDLCGIRGTAASLGVHPGDGGDLSALPSSVLGTNTISPETMAAAYAAFADSGTWCVPYTVARVTDGTGAVLVQASPECHQAMDAGVADAVTAALGQVLARGTAAGNGIDWPAAGKTGTTNDEVGDTWFVGYTRQLSTAVYVGTPFTDKVSLASLDVGGHRGKVFGATFAAPIWRAYMQRAMAGLPQQPFPAPPPPLVGP
jgi:membrane peptidoglycan carboxypeptidase